MVGRILTELGKMKHCHSLDPRYVEEVLAPMNEVIILTDIVRNL